MPVSPKGECVLHYVPYGAFRSSHRSSPTARRPMAPSHAVVRSNARSLEGTCIFIHRLFAPPRTCRGLWSLVQEKGLWCTKWENRGFWYRRGVSGVPIGGEILRYVRMTYGEEIGGGAWITRGRPWPRERVDGACARRDGAKRKVFQVPPPISGIARTGTSVGDVRG